jgi:hypothetical protein
MAFLLGSREDSVPGELFLLTSEMRLADDQAKDEPSAREVRKFR